MISYEQKQVKMLTLVAPKLNAISAVPTNEQAALDRKKFEKFSDRYLKN